MSLEAQRNLNLILSCVAIVVMLFPLVRTPFQEANPNGRLRYMALLLACFMVAYGTFEVLYLTTTFRVWICTIFLFWVIVASLGIPKQPRR